MLNHPTHGLVDSNSNRLSVPNCVNLLLLFICSENTNSSVYCSLRCFISYFEVQNIYRYVSRKCSSFILYLELVGDCC